ncbi:MAG: adenylyltransferase/cytidyltransferase family protein [Chitinispirillaceae bacterium]
MKTEYGINICDDVTQMQRIIEPLRREKNRTLITTNGCFDLLHAGHVRYLCEAARRGDLLVVGINADETVKKLKGPQRPIQGEKDRLLVVGSLKMVFGAFIFREDDPRVFLEVLKPDIHVKGGDYSRDILERETVEKNGGNVEIVSYLNGYSTSSIVTRIRSV